jgi:large subunit ribosomal protein L22
MTKIVTVTLRHQRVSPKKMRLVLGLVRGRSATEASEALSAVEKKSAGLLRNLLKSGVSACRAKDYKEEELVVSEAVCQEGKKFKRTAVDARGRSRGFMKRMSHVKLTLSKKESDGADKAAKAAVPATDKITSDKGKKNGPKN